MKFHVADGATTNTLAAFVMSVLLASYFSSSRNSPVS